MGAKNSSNSQTTFFKLRAKTSDTDPKPFFGKSEKINNVWTTTDTFNQMAGFLVGISHDKYEYEGETKWKAIFKFKDADGSLNQVEAGFNNLTYSILNSLLTIQPRYVTIEVWLGKAKVENGKAGKQYPNASVYNTDGEQEPTKEDKAQWSISPDNTPRPEKVKVGNKTVTDDTNVVEFWKGKIDEIAKTLVAEPKTNYSAPANRMQPNPKAEEQHEVGADDDNSPPF